MTKQLHMRFTNEAVREILVNYEQGEVTLKQALSTLGICRRRFFALLKQYRTNPEIFSISYCRAGVKQISEDTEQLIQKELLEERSLVENKDMPVRHYNYSAVRDALRDQYAVTVSVPTIIDRAKELGCWQGRPPKKKHDRQVLTNNIGELTQHDSSCHRWSPWITEKYYALTSLDDFSRLLLYADLLEQENSWVHIQALRSAVIQFGCPVGYYTDQHRIFRFIQGRDSWHRTHVALTDDVDPQWKKVVKDCGIKSIYALCAQGKGKIERPYQWMQDRVVRRCAKDHVVRFNEIREIFRSEVYRYNNKQVHSTTGEIPIIRFERAKREQLNLFRPFSIPPPFTLPEDIFALRAERTTTGYGMVSLKNIYLKTPNVPAYQKVQLKLVPNLEQQRTRVRIWYKERLVNEYTIPFNDLPFDKL